MSSSIKHLEKAEFDRCIMHVKSGMDCLTDQWLVQSLLKQNLFKNAGVQQALVNISTVTAGHDIERAREAAQELFVALSNAFGEVNLAPLFCKVADYERNLFSLIPLYRDHSVHSIRVFLTGAYIMNRMAYKTPTLFDKVFHRNEMDYSMLFKWFLTSIFHDIGIPIEKFVDQNNALERFYQQYPGFDFERARLNPKHSWLISLSEFSEKIAPEPKIRDRLLRNIDKKEHGIIGAITLLHLAGQGILDMEHIPPDYYELYIEPYVMPAARAIALHNDSDTEILFEEDPMCFLLILCDEIQEWERSIVAGRMIVGSGIFADTYIGVEAEKQRLKLRTLLFSNGRTQQMIVELNPSYSPIRLVTDKIKNLRRLRSSEIRGDFHVAWTSAGTKADPDLRRGTISTVLFGN